ncbi:DUF2127 domain-containing protein [Eubacteriaceae bacterium ES2]|nr:DUF2127 domain-containing protein [Eubacteriaceae bacterium ES2]
MNRVFENKNIAHIGFEIGLIFKGVDGLLEIVGGILLLFLNSDRLDGITRVLTQNELSEDPNDLFANLLLTVSSSFSISAQHFAVIYLVSHGLIKCILILFLWQKKLWAYPLAMGVLILFIAYQIYRIILSPSPFMILMTIFDALMVSLTWIEYQKMKKLVNI